MAYWWSKLRDSIGPSPVYSVICNLSLSSSCLCLPSVIYSSIASSVENVSTQLGSSHGKISALDLALAPTETVPLLCRDVNGCKTSSFILSPATVPELLCLCSSLHQCHIYARQLLIPFASNIKLYIKLIPAHFFSLSGLRSSLQQRKPGKRFSRRASAELP